MLCVWSRAPNSWCTRGSSAQSMRLGVPRGLFSPLDSFSIAAASNAWGSDAILGSFIHSLIQLSRFIEGLL